METTKERIVFSSNIFVQFKKYEFQVLDKEHIYDYSMKRSFVEVVTKYEIPFLIKKVENGIWLQENTYIKGAHEIVLYLSDNLHLSIPDVILLLDYLFKKNIIKIVSKTITLEELIHNFKKVNKFYKIDINTEKYNIFKHKILKIQDETIFIEEFAEKFYKESSHAIKYTLDVIFYHILNYIRNTHIKREKVEGYFEGCSFVFQGYEGNVLNEEKIILRRVYESFNEYAVQINALRKYGEIKKFSEKLQ